MSIESPQPPAGSPAWWSLHWRRTAAIGAVLVLLIGTHIPRLAIGPEEDGPDKLMHLAAFATIAMLVRVATPGRSIVFAGAFALGLAFFDETTQELPGLNRSFDPLDLVADGGGIAVALAWCAALGPPRRGPDWFREAYRRRIAGYRLLLSSFGNWMHLAVAGVLGAMIGGVLLAVAGRNPVVGPITMTVVGAETGLVAGVVGALEIGRRHAAARLDAERRCLRCLRPDVAPGTRCECGEPAVEVDAERRVAPRRLLLPTAITLLVASLVLVGGYLAVQGLRYRLVRPWPIFSWYDRLFVADAMAFDAIILGLVAAAAVGITRRIAARCAEAEGVRCLRCGHDLQGTPDEAGVGRCPECGTSFRRGFAATAPTGEHAGS